MRPVRGALAGGAAFRCLFGDWLGRRGEPGTGRGGRVPGSQGRRSEQWAGCAWTRREVASGAGVEMLSVFPTSNQAGAKVKENRLRAQNFRNNI